MRDTPPATGEDGQQKKKKKSHRGSATPVPPDYEAFPGMITRDEVIRWFQSRGGVAVPMSDPIKAYMPRMKRGTAEEKEKNQKLLVSYIRQTTDSVEGKKLRLKPEFM